MKDNLHLGFDIGSISINTVVMDDDRNIIENRYDFCHGKPFNLLKDLLTDILKKYSKDSIQHISITGTGGKLAQELIGGHFINEIIAQSTSVAQLYPEVKTVIEMGGEDSKLIFMHEDEEEKTSRLCASPARRPRFG